MQNLRVRIWIYIRYVRVLALMYWKRNFHHSEGFVSLPVFRSSIGDVNLNIDGKGAWTDRIVNGREQEP